MFLIVPTIHLDLRRQEGIDNHIYTVCAIIPDGRLEILERLLWSVKLTKCQTGVSLHLFMDDLNAVYQQIPSDVALFFTKCKLY